MMNVFSWLVYKFRRHVYTDKVNCPMVIGYAVNDVKVVNQNV